MLETQLRAKPREGDVVELLEDLPQYDLRQGQRGAIITEFAAPNEAYDIAFEDEEGNFLGFGYSVKPSQFKNISRETYERGMRLLTEGDETEAERVLQQVIELSPGYISGIHNSFMYSFAEVEEWADLIRGMRLVLRLDPTYQYARNNLAIANLNFGVQKAKEGDTDTAITLFQYAIAVDADPDIVSHIRQNFAAAFTTLGRQEHERGDFNSSLQYMRLALISFPSEDSRLNVGKAHIHLAQFHLRSGKYHDAVLAFEAAEDTGLIAPELLNDHAIALIFVGRLEEGIRVLERASAMAPENQVIRNNLAMASDQGTKENLAKQEIEPQFAAIAAAAAPGVRMAAVA